MRRPSRLVALASAAGLLCVGLSLVAREEVYGPASLRQRTSLALVELGRLAGLRPDEAPPRPLSVVLAQEGGPLWMQAGFSTALARDAVFGAADPSTNEAPHLVRAEVVSEGPRHAVRLALHRMGWSLALPQAFALQLSPWIAALSAVLGAWLWPRLRVLGLVVAGVLAQGLSLVGPWPLPSGRPPLVAVWREGWLGAAIGRAAMALPESATAFGAGLVALSVVLVYFDHRRSHERGLGYALRGLLGVAAVFAWLEAALRVGVGGFVTTPIGLAWAMTLAVVWGLVLSSRRGTGRSAP